MSGRAGRKIGPWAVETETAVYDNAWISVADCRVIRPDGAPGQYGVVHFKNIAVGVLPLLDDGTVPLVGQHRFPHDAYSWEVPEGGGPVGADPRLAAERELAEETGYRARHWLEMAAFDLSNSVTDERAVCFLAWGLEAGTPDPDGDEMLAHRLVRFSELHEMVLKGDIRDSMTIIMVLKARALAAAGHLPDAPLRLILAAGK